MSIRGHKVIKIEYEEGETFNAWHDEMFMDLVGDLIYDTLNMDGCGIVEFEDTQMEEIMEEDMIGRKEELIKKYSKEEYDETVVIIKQIIKDCKEKDGFCCYGLF